MFLVKEIILTILVFSIHIINAQQENTNNNLARGFGDDINWVTLEDSLKIAKEESKGIMVIIHKTWCGACKNLKPRLKESLKFKELSNSFVMVNLENDEEPSDPKYSPDGSYIPRILFLNKDGEVINDLYNKQGNDKYKYYYPSEFPLINTMNRAIDLFGSENKTEYTEKAESIENSSNESKQKNEDL